MNLLTEWDAGAHERSTRRRELGSLMRTALDRAATAPAAAYTCGQLFTQGDPVSRAHADAALGADLTDLACQEGLLLRLDEDFVRSTASIARVELSAAPVWVASDFGWQDLEPGYVGGPGNAASTIARAMIPKNGTGPAVDMGTGSGALAVLLAARYDDVIVTDINPRALAYAELTAALNDRRWQCRLGSFSAALAAAHEPTYIVSNPPFVLGNPDRSHQFRDAPGGARQPFRLIEEFSQVLADGGVAQFLANWVYLAGSDDDPIAAILTHAVDHDCDVLVIERAMVDLPTYVDLWTDERDGRHRAWVDRLAEAGARAVGTGIVTIRRRRTGDPFYAVRRLHEASDGAFGEHLGRWVDRLRITDDVAGLSGRLVLRTAPYVTCATGPLTDVRVADALGLSALVDGHDLQTEVLPILDRCRTPRQVADIDVPGLRREQVVELLEWYVEVGLLEPVGG